ncbi:MAG: DUF732 domain-containing protein [Mycobacterium sp.]
MIGKVLVGAVGAVVSVALAAPASANSPQDFLAAARAAGVTGTDPAMLGDGYNVCWQLWNQHAPGTQVAAGLVRDHPGLSADEAGHFVLAAYNDLCPVPGAYDYWAYSTS